MPRDQQVLLPSTPFLSRWTDRRHVTASALVWLEKNGHVDFLHFTTNKAVMAGVHLSMFR